MGEAACRNLYSCPETENLVEGRRGEACVYSAPFCPGFAAGCSMCGIFNPGLCAGLCPVAGLTCGTIGDICNPAITDYNVPKETPPASKYPATNMDSVQNVRGHHSFTFFTFCFRLLM